MTQSDPMFIPNQKLFCEKLCGLGMVYVMFGCSFVQFTSKQVLTEVSVTRMQRKRNSPLSMISEAISHKKIILIKRKIWGTWSEPKRERERARNSFDSSHHRMNSIRKTTNETLDTLAGALLLLCHILSSSRSFHVTITTGGGFFAECLRHSAKADIHSAKPLPSVILGKGRSVNSLSAKTSLSSALYRALGKAFAEC